ncbi:DNA helicase/exodeoxyribonuclease V subunit A [Natranaerovirga hydrolytica]|uniref:ATP-dependent helicase/nuclease subunit A n=1 Tax=Natranaerovirga hydrolytica TaxID=680378 RepID=A0A4R1MR74_9FIRM|nr:helicase-exonuclease AddAB subunit AddA [Natranaerovirga hydrolytica]TCK92393.1 DNA helicase/exodeoxyribonuclease V subunit A [Natranaerovirga hydrolytica]
MAVKWTKEQKKVIDSRNRNLLVSAAAGSGKTAVLVERIIQMISEDEHPIDIDKLLVVTFTNAAAAEMKERIGAAIEDKLIQNPSNPYLHKQLSLLEHAHITTIHSFCLYVLRNYFHLIDLDPSFRIADETELTLLRSDVIKDVLEKHYKLKEDEFLALVESYTTNRSDDPLEEIILKIYTFAQSYPWPKKWLNNQIEPFNVQTIEDLETTQWIKVIDEYIKHTLSDLRNSLCQGIQLCQLTKGPHMYLENLKDDLEQLDAIIQEDGLSGFYKAFNELKFTTLSRKRDKDVDTALREDVKNIRNEVKKTLEKIKTDYFYQEPIDMVEDLNRLMPINQKLIELVLDFMEEYRKAKEEKNILDFNDLEHLALNLLVEEDGQPSMIARELQEQFDEILIDEYQDSNLVQETLLQSVSKVHLGEPNIFMVGDVKQSIYKFRLAKPELFMEKYNTYSTEESAYHRIDLHKNFRSRKEVIESVNYLFYQLMSKEIGDVHYNESTALYNGADFQASEEEDLDYTTEVYILDSQKDIEDVEEDIDLSQREVEAKLIAKRIKELMNPDHPYKVYDKKIERYRPIQYRDIVILLRTVSGWAEVFSDILMEEGIPAYCDTASGYFETTEIKIIMSVLKIIDNPRQDIPLLSVLRSPIIGLTTEELAMIKNSYSESEFYDALMTVLEEPFENHMANKIKNFFIQLKTWQDKVLYTPIHELLLDIYQVTNYYDYAGVMQGGKQRQSNLDMLIEKAQQFEKSSYRGLFHFIRLMDKLEKYQVDFGEASILGENEDLVRIMTIHKSKGLEFPVVFVSALGKPFNKQDIFQSINIHLELGLGPDYINYEQRYKKPTIAKKAIQKKLEIENLSEELRVLYVALTRAKEKLILTGSISSRTTLAKRLEKWSSICNHKNIKLPYNTVLTAGNYLDWILFGLMRHPSAQNLLETIEKNNSIDQNTFTEDVDFYIRALNLEDIVMQDVVEEIEKNKIKDELVNWKYDDVQDKEWMDQINHKLLWEYPYKNEVNVHVKMTVSELKKASMEGEEEIPSIIKQDSEMIKPKFLEESTYLTPAEKGTLMHKVMQYLPLDVLNDYKKIKEGLNELEEKGFISEKEKNVIYIKDILAFSKTKLIHRMLKAKEQNHLYKEKQFVLGLKASELNETYKSDELVLLQGVIDCYFEEEDELVLVDYKTDYITEGNESILIHRYTEQLGYYQKALEQITRKKVKEKIIYSFSLNKEIYM